MMSGKHRQANEVILRHVVFYQCVKNCGVNYFVTAITSELVRIIGLYIKPGIIHATTSTLPPTHTHGRGGAAEVRGCRVRPYIGDK